MSFYVGVDVGGTKTHIKVVVGEHVLTDHVGPSTGWDAVPAPQAADWLTRHIRSAVLRAVNDAALIPDHVVVGAHGCETQQQCTDLERALRERLETDCTVVNDAHLLVPAAGLSSGIGLVAGTGAIAVGHRADDGSAISAGGWGWVLGDDGSASALVREGARALLRLADAGAPSDVLERHLLESFAAPDLVTLAHAMSWDGGVETWGAHAHAIFAAAEEGSAAAAGVIVDGARSLATLVAALVARGAAGADVVVAGGVVTAQPRLRNALFDALAQQAPGLRLHILERPPVDGALALARAGTHRSGRNAT
ncbi:BadF-type ATPase [Sanguibacter gelidistatuariae]|uniref:BadF-type ATPase n=1 Tax=Sanguibacter gelidistatuariae TaxID=1814289 RepID=A0A1G6MUP1_9MICO|nr:BadF/BadG/BcrA/BcrD ATPase family protein [Sanguibacter gelidistatuariae]SDC58917.1 BadF-type ATPase [Sanguibacter gelidistatuariae]